MSDVKVEVVTICDATEANQIHLGHANYQAHQSAIFITFLACFRIRMRINQLLVIGVIHH